MSDREKARVSEAKYRAANREKIREWQKQDYIRHRDKRRAARNEYYEANREAVRAKTNRYKEDAYVARIGRTRPSVCEVCGGDDGGIVFDHCHDTGRARGWLCRMCNIVIGAANDDPERLRKLIEYLRAFDHRPS